MRKFETWLQVVYGIDELWQMVLVDLSKLSKLNDGYKFLIAVIDVLSKFGWLIPLESKEGKYTRYGLSKLFSSTKLGPLILQMDMGKEFLNTVVLICKKLYYTFFE